MPRRAKAQPWVRGLRSHSRNAVWYQNVRTSAIKSMKTLLCSCLMTCDEHSALKTTA